MVDFPSPGKELVTTKTFWSWSTSTYCMLVRSTRKASAQGVASVSDILGSRRADVVLLWMLPRMGAGVTCPTSSVPVMLVSSSSRATARPTPSSRPSTTASPRLRRGCGETGVVGTWALSTMDALISALDLPGRCLQVGHHLAQALGVGLGQVAGRLGIGVGRRDLQDDRLGHHLCGDLVGQGVGIHRAPEAVADPGRQLTALDQVGVGGHALGGEQAAGVGVAGVGLAGGDEDAGRRRILRGRLPGQEAGNCHHHQEADEHNLPAVADRVPVVLELHRAPFCGGRDPREGPRTVRTLSGVMPPDGMPA